MVSNEVRHNLMFILSAIADRNQGDVQLIWNADAIDIVRNLIDDGYVNVELEEGWSPQSTSIMFLLVGEPGRFTLTESGHNLMLWLAQQVLEQERIDDIARRN